eukprot:89672_1
MTAKSRGDYHNNWETNLIAANPTMKKDYDIVGKVISYWIRMNDMNDILFPQCIVILSSEFYVIARCGNCGTFGSDDFDSNLYLNLYDGFIGCSRFFNECSILHYQQKHQKMSKQFYKTYDFSQQITDDTKINMRSMVVNITTICETGADVWCYYNDDYVFDKENEYVLKFLTLNKLKKQLHHWGIQMNKYKWDKSIV